MAKNTTEELIQTLIKIPLDVFLSSLSGLILIGNAIHCYRGTHAHKYKYFITGPDQNDVIGWCTLSLGILGLLCISVATLRLRGFCKLNFNKYVALLVFILLSTFATGMVLTDFRTSVEESLGDSMRTRLQEAMLSQSRLGVGFAQSDYWDFLQTKMGCCGVDTYQEYFQRKGSRKDQTLPMSCCVMKQSSEGGELTADNPSQCMLDATRGVVDSIFLHVTGCHGPLTRWVVHHISRMTAFIFAAILVQAISLLFLSWRGYYRSNVNSRQR